MFKRILIANRGEIACRIIKTARRMGIETVAVYSEADRDALHVEMADEAVPIGPPPAAQSYLVIEKIVAACRKAAPRRCIPATAFYPSAPLSPRRWPKPALFSSVRTPRRSPPWATRSKARRLAARAKVSTVPGYLGVIDDENQAVKIADEIGYPVMIKASAGGGGKGMRIALRQSRGRGGLRARPLGGEIELRRRPGFHREVHHRSAPHRDPGARRQARQRHLSRRARMFDPAPQSESRRGSAEPAARRRRRAAKMGEQAVALAKAVGYDSPAPWSSSPGRTAAFISWK